MSKLKKEKVRGKKDNESFYKTRSGALLVVRNSIVVTVLSRDMHRRMISRFFK